MSSYVLDFDPQGGIYAPHVNHGYFWTPGATMTGNFAVQAWVMPRLSASRYWYSEGYGGLHGGGLFGFTGDETSLYLFGEFGPTNVSGATQITPGTWNHVAFSYDSSYLRCYLNGVMDGKTAWSGTRVIADLEGGGGELFIGGSTHSTFDGRIAAVELWEEQSGYPVYPSDQTFCYTRRFQPHAWNGSTPMPASFFALYSTPQDVVPDLSRAGYNGGLHSGQLFDATAGEWRGEFYGPGSSGLYSPPHIPTWVIDTNSPLAQ